jgi:hypothetical protein
MSKGRRPPRNPDNNPPINPRDPSPPDPDITVDPRPPQCWTFPLVRTTQAAERVQEGTHVSGSVHSRTNVMVRAEGETLGFAPEAEAKEIIAAVQELKGRLSGHVISSGNGKKNVIVELCL